MSQVSKFDKSAGLKHVSTSDRSQPVIEADTHIRPNPQPTVMKELTRGGSAEGLKHVETRDHSEPVIEADVHIGANPQPVVMVPAAVRTQHSLAAVPVRLIPR